MLGLGEKENEIHVAIEDLAKIGLDILTLGQYLQPSPEYARIDQVGQLRRICRLEEDSPWSWY